MVKRRVYKEEKIDDLPMTPMIDVVFQLLIFFMLMPMNRTVEGKLFSQLPKDKGLMSTPATNPELKEVRIKMQYDKQTGVTKVFIEKLPIGEVRPTISMTIPASETTANATNNAGVWQQLATKADDLYHKIPSSRDPTKPAPVIIDADPATPWEHVVGAVNACKTKGIDNIEFVGNPNFKDLYK